MSIIILLIIGYTIAVSIFVIPKIENSIYSLEKKNSKILLHEIVSISNTVHTDIGYFQKVALGIHKKSLHHINSIAYFILQNSYDKYKNGELSETEAKRSAYRKISQLRYGEDGYFFVIDDNYNVLAHADEKMIGKNRRDLQDIKGKYFIQEMIDGARSNKERFVRYWWPKIIGEPFEKLSYIKKFEPWNIYLGTGIYIDNISKTIEKRKKVLFGNLRQIIINTKIGETGYIYVLNSKAEMIYHPDSALEGTNVKHLKNPTKETFLFDDLMQAFKTNKELSYKWNKPNDKENYNYEKLSWIEYIPDLDWYIISSAYVDELDQTSNKLKESLAFIGMVLLFLSILIAALFFKKLDKEIEEKTEEIQVLKERMDLALFGNNGGIWEWNLLDDSVYFSPQWEKMLGYRENKLPQNISSWKVRVHPDDMEAITSSFQTNIDAKAEYIESAYRLKHKNGQWIWIICRGIIQYDKSGEAVRVIGTHTDITQRKKVEDELHEQKLILDHQAHHDALTGLPNRVLLNDRLDHGIKKSKRNNSKFALLFIDLDYFKEINDSLGHIVGDKVLKIVAQRLNESIRKEDTLARLGGDEFTIIMEDLGQADDVSQLAQKIIEVLIEPIVIKKNVLYVSCSIGISLYPEDSDNAHDLLKFADVAMYKAKDEGRNNFQFYSSEMTKLVWERVEMEASLREAFKNKEFIVYYQPQVNAKTDTLIGMEGLVRWQHPTMGLISVNKFLPLMQKTGLIIQLDQWVMKTAVMQMVQWQKEGFNPGVLALNLTIKQLEEKAFIATLEAMIKETGCKPECLELEINEGEIMKNPEKAILACVRFIRKKHHLFL